MTEPKMKNFKCQNRACSRIVAETDGENIYFDDKPFPLKPKKIVFDCPHCAKLVTWFSENYKKEK